MTEATTARRTRITPEREAELYEAVLDLLREVGYDGLTMGAVATRTRSSKATLYRQWGGKPELVATALRSTRPGRSADLDTGSLRADLHARVKREDDSVRERNFALTRSLFVAVHSNSDLRKAFRELLIEPEAAEIHRVLRRAVDRGEVRAGNPAIEYAPHMFVGCLVTRSLIDELPPTQEFVISYVDAVILPSLGVSAA